MSKKRITKKNENTITKKLKQQPETNEYRLEYTPQNNYQGSLKIFRMRDHKKQTKRKPIKEEWDSEEEESEEESDFEDVFPPSEEGSLLFSKLSSKYTLSQDQVKHGDALIFNDYRGVGLWLVEEFTEKNKKIKMIHKTYGEYGYCIPSNLHSQSIHSFLNKFFFFFYKKFFFFLFFFLFF